MNFLDKVNLVFLWVERNFTRPVFGRPIVFGIVLVFLFIGLSVALTVLIVKHKRHKRAMQNIREKLHTAYTLVELTKRKLSVANNKIEMQDKELAEFKAKLTEKPTAQVVKKGKKHKK